jgi:hypothetical protein
MPATSTAPETTAPETETPKNRSTINRENAQSSTGPRTPEGKAASAQNALKFGLFSTKNCVLPQDQDEYNELAAYLWTSLHPVGAIEELHATEVIRCAWRLRRCSEAESVLPQWNRQVQKRRQPDQPEDRNLADPVLYDYTAKVQTSVDRARTQAQACLRRSLADLTALQTERQVRKQLLPASVDHAALGLARVKEVFVASANPAASTRNEAQSRLASITREQQLADADMESRLASLANPPTKQTPRNAPCPCGSSQKHKRCCGQNAPPVLTMAA